MQQDQIEGLQKQRDHWAGVVEQLLNTPEAERPTAPKALRAWVRELESAQQLLAQLDAIIGSGERAKARLERKATDRKPKPSTDTSGNESLVLAKIPQSINYELRVSLHTWKGRRTIDVRTYWLKAPGEALPTKRGMQVDVSRLPALLEALKSAMQHV
jgi:hypothetical protein